VTNLPADIVVMAPEDRRDALLDAIRKATSRITLSLFRCNDKALFAELTAAVDRGVQVDVLMTSRAKGGQAKLQKLWDRVEATGSSIHTYRDPVVKYHAKYLVVDDGPALIASLNFTKKCFSKTCDAIVVTYDRGIIEGLRTLMEIDQQGLPAPASISERLIIGPERARRQLTALIEQAASSIRIIDPKLTDPDLVTLLRRRKAEGISVEIYGGKQLAGLKSHGKIMLIDGRRAVVGSLALAALSLDFRREIAVTVDEPGAIAAIDRWFGSLDATPETDPSRHRPQEAPSW
jgi:phosphatidylserine/phosphatidylglycerophosphate/cardiolipin synthase-like enzyme